MQRRKTQRPIPTYISIISSNKQHPSDHAKKIEKGNQLKTFLSFVKSEYIKAHIHIRRKRKATAAQWSSNLSLPKWKQALHAALTLSILSLPILQRKKTSLPYYSILPWFPLDGKWEKEKPNPLKLSLLFSSSLRILQPSLLLISKMPTLSSSSFFSFIAQGGV